jgi:hypothetical protein
MRCKKRRGLAKTGAKNASLFLSAFPVFVPSLYSAKTPLLRRKRSGCPARLGTNGGTNIEKRETVFRFAGLCTTSRRRSFSSSSPSFTTSRWRWSTAARVWSGVRFTRLFTSAAAVRGASLGASESRSTRSRTTWRGTGHTTSC